MIPVFMRNECVFSVLFVFVLNMRRDNRNNLVFTEFMGKNETEYISRLCKETF